PGGLKPAGRPRRRARRRPQARRGPRPAASPGRPRHPHRPGRPARPGPGRRLRPPLAAGAGPGALQRGDLPVHLHRGRGVRAGPLRPGGGLLALLGARRQVRPADRGERRRPGRRRPPADPALRAGPSARPPAPSPASAATGALTAAFGASLRAPHGGLWVTPLIGDPLMFLLALVIGTAVTAGAVLALKGLRRTAPEPAPEPAAA